MGVPSFYRWLVNKYPKVVAKAIEDVDTTMPNPNGLEFDNLYLDMNGIIHPCFHPDDEKSSMPTTFEDVFENIFGYIDRLVSIVRPGKLLYMAIDGVAPRAKMNQQRARRFRTAKDNDMREAIEESLRKQFEIEGKKVLPKQESQVSDSNIITPGTEFMHQLSEALQNYVSSRMASYSLLTDIKVILSDANVPGEGEHKIMSYIRKQRSLPGYDPNTRHCLYGLDADLIMLAMTSHEPHFSILREDVILQEQQPQNAANKPFEFLHVWLLRQYLELDLKIENPPKNISIDFERTLDDFIFICFFAGNDFLPHMPSLEIHEGAIDLLMSVYKRQFGNIGGYLVDMSRVGEKKAAFVKLSRVERFILMVGTHEEKIFKKRSEIRERKLRRLVSDYEDAKQDEFDEGNSSDSALHIDNNSSADILQNTKDLKELVNKCIRQKSDLFKSGDFFIDKVKLGTAGFKERYYKEKFSVERPTDIESKRKEIVQKYTEGLVWVLQYYYSGVVSWTWFYPYHYGPFASDLRGMGQVRLNFEKGAPFLPFDQLLSVLPPRSSHALPDCYAQLMLDEKSPIIDFFPLDFEVDIDGKRFMWQAICKLPFIEERLLLAETRKLKSGLSENEAIRNSVKLDTLFVRSCSSLGVKICSLMKKESYPSFKLEANNISDGIGGIISLCNERLEKHCLGLKICDNELEDHAFCVCYDLPVGNGHIPGLLPGVNLPAEKIFEVDIAKTELWHERQRERPFVSGANSRNNATKFVSNSAWQSRRTFSSNGSRGISYKGGGTGWGTGSGRGHHVNGDRDTRPIGGGGAHFCSSRNGFNNASNNAFHRGFQSVTRPNVWGRGRGSTDAHSWGSVDEEESIAEECFARIGRAERIADEYMARTRMGGKKTKGKALDDY